jgi:hypothetical protein
MALPSQDELRRRLRAARVLSDLTVAELAARIDPDANIGERTLRKLEGGESKLREPALRTLAAAMRFPYEWFTIRSIPEAIGGRSDLTARIEALELWAEGGPSPTQPASNSAAVDRPSPAESRPSAQRRGPRGTRQARGR